MVGSQIASQGCLSSQADFRRFYIPDSYARVRVSPQTQKNLMDSISIKFLTL